MIESTSTNLTEFVETPDDPTESDSDHWPVHANGHNVIRVKPTQRVTGSGDQDLAFECTLCGECIHIPEDRAIPDHEYAANRFSLSPCSTTDSVPV